MEIIQVTLFGVNPNKRHGGRFTVQHFDDGNKQCTKCREVKPIDSFSRGAGSYDGRHTQCRACVARWGKKDRYQRKTVSWDRNYRISEQVYWDLFEQQGGVCALCHHAETWIHRGTPALLSVDHCHTTGRVRGLLCRRCNIAIAQFGDDPERLRAAAAYLQSV